jgi:hypothetical protein
MNIITARNTLQTDQPGVAVKLVNSIREVLESTPARILALQIFHDFTQIVHINLQV